MPITLVKNDYETPLVFHAKTRDKIIPLVGSKVLFDMVSKANNQKVGGGECEVGDPATGVAKYTFKEPELGQVGEFQGKVTIDLSQGARREGLALDFQIIEQPKKK